jgi:hypothetical protein
MAAGDPIADSFRVYGQTLSYQHQHWRTWQRLPLAIKSMRRAGRGVWVLTFCAYLVAETRGAAASPVLLVPALLGIMWVAAGIHGARGARDIVSGIWWGITGLGWGVLLAKQLYPADWGPFAALLLQGVYIASLAAAAIRCWLALRPMPRTKLPHPSKIGLPAGGLASPAAAHAALTRGSARPSWKFW